MTWPNVSSQYVAKASTNIPARSIKKFFIFLPETEKKMAIHFWFHKHFCKVLHIMWRCYCGVVLTCEINSLLSYSFPLIQRCWTYNLRSHQVMEDATLLHVGSLRLIYIQPSCSQGSWQQTPFWCENNNNNNKTTQKLDYSCGLWLWVSDSYL